MRFKPGPMGERRVTQEVMKVVVMGGNALPKPDIGLHYKYGLPSVDIFSFIVNTWEKNGETFTATTSTWTKGRIKFATLS